MNGIVRAFSGRPITPQFAQPDFGQQRPDQIGDPTQNIPAGRAFNPFAYAEPDVRGGDNFGNSGRNTVFGPRFVNVDFSLVRNFKLTERLRLQFRAEAFNALNHVNLNIPIFQLDQVLFNTALSVADRLAQSRAGTYNQTRNEMRELQFALRLNF